MTVVRKQTEQGLVFIDEDAKHWCGIILGESGVTHILRKPDGHLLNSDFRKDQSQNADSVIQEIEMQIEDKTYVLMPNLLSLNGTRGSSLKEFLTDWLEFEASQLSIEDKFIQLADMVKQGKITDPAAKQSARKFQMQTLMETFFGDQPSQLTTALRDDLIQYDKSLPTNKISMDRSGG